jgi:UDP-N-acetyl-D-mannosaminuronate dehydrogenase
VIVVGMGEIGKPLHAVLSRTYRCLGVDIEPVSVDLDCSVLHICYPYQIKDFVNTTVSYIEKYRPQMTIINSTVPPGTTSAVHKASKAAIAYSPVRGKHAKMEQELLRYKKFVAGMDSWTTEQAVQHFATAGFTTDTFRAPEVGELSKLLETTWLGVLVGWAQEVQRFASCYGASYEEVNAYLKEIDFLPSHIFPGSIGGHCVMPNIGLLRDIFASHYLDAVVDSNEREAQAESAPKKELLCRELA